MARKKYGKIFRCKKGKFKGKLVKYDYSGSRKKMVRHKTSRWRY